MTTLRVKFPGDWPGWSIPEYNLNSVQDHWHTKTRNSITVTVDSQTYSDYNSDSPVFRASLVDPSSGAIVALKFALREDLIPDLAQEAEVYTGALEPLQGITIPRCYGLYAGSGEDGRPIACLVLEYWGECIHQPFVRLPLGVRCVPFYLPSVFGADEPGRRIRILQRLGEIHRQGLLHGDFAERNVLEMDGDIRIIDFDRTEYHDCDCDMDFRPGDTSPDIKEFGCAQLWKVCRADMRIWDRVCSLLCGGYSFCFFQLSNDKTFINRPPIKTQIPYLPPCWV